MLFISYEGKDSCLHLNALFEGHGVKELCVLFSLS